MKNNGLQKFTLLGKKVTSDPELSRSEKRLLTDVLTREKISSEAYQALPDKERALYRTAADIAANKLTFESKDLALQHLENVGSEDGKRQMWDRNHMLILNSINAYVRKNNRFPTITETSREIGLSRVTITKHLREYHGSSQYEEKKAEFIMMRERVLSAAYTMAMDGDIRAAQLFINATDQLILPGKSSLVNIITVVAGDEEYHTHR